MSTPHSISSTHLNFYRSKKYEEIDQTFLAYLDILGRHDTSQRILRGVFNNGDTYERRMGTAKLHPLEHRLEHAFSVTVICTGYRKGNEDRWARTNSR